MLLIQSVLRHQGGSCNWERYPNFPLYYLHVLFIGSNINVLLNLQSSKSICFRSNGPALWVSDCDTLGCDKVPLIIYGGGGTEEKRVG